MSREYNIGIYVPYLTFKNLKFYYNKKRQLDESEAILLSFIHSVKESNKNGSSQFLDLYNNTFNLNDKWDKFTLSLLKKMLIDKTINIDSEIDEKLLMDEITINADISKSLGQMKFEGSDGKDIVKEKIVNRAVFESFVSKDELLTIDTEYEKITEKDINEKLLSVSEKNDISEELNDLANKIEPQLIFIELKNTEDYLITFNKVSKPISIDVKKDIITINTNDIKTDEIIKKYIDIGCDSLIPYSLIKHYNLDKYSYLELTEGGEFIDINDYPNILENNMKLNKELGVSTNLFILDQTVYSLKQKEFNVMIKDVPAGKIKLLVQEVFLPLDEYAISLFKNRSTINKAHLLFDRLNDMSSINTFIRNNDYFITDSELSFYKKYAIDKIYVNDDLTDKEIQIFMISQNVKKEELSTILVNNPNSMKRWISFTSEYDDSTDLALSKLKLFISTFQFNPLSFKVKCNLVNKYKNLNENIIKLSNKKDMDIIDLKTERKKLYIEAEQLTLKDSALMDVFKEPFDNIDNRIKVLEEQDLEHTKAKYSDLSIAVSSIMNAVKRKRKDIKTQEDLFIKLTNQHLKTKWKEIKSYRNKFQHDVEEESSSPLLPDQSKSKELREINIKLNEYINWLKVNKENILKDLEKQGEK